MRVFRRSKFGIYGSMFVWWESTIFSARSTIFGEFRVNPGREVSKASSFSGAAGSAKPAPELFPAANEGFCEFL